ncbi:MAG: acyl-CoA desaturase [Pseudomonadota bacterium]
MHPITANDVYKVNSLEIGPQVDPLHGKVTWDAARSIWNGSMLFGALFIAPFFFTWGAFAVFLIGLEITLCCGHSVGFHRRLIHRTFECPKWVERVLVYLGVLVGMHGPFWVIRSHDIRDWAQRQRHCHPYLCHGDGILNDGLWNLHYTLKLDHPPTFDAGKGIADDWFYIFLQRTWMWHQLPLAIIFYAVGGWPWVMWGVVARVAAGVHMHWFVGYLCHTHGSQDWLVDDGAVQARNVHWAAIPSMGECWHNNHHAFPASARHGVYPGQIDIGYQFVRLLERLGLASNIQTPDKLPPRAGITPITERARGTLTIQQKRSGIQHAPH